jgi:hypothetical protein
MLVKVKRHVILLFATRSCSASVGGLELAKTLLREAYCPVNQAAAPQLEASG